MHRNSPINHGLVDISILRAGSTCAYYYVYGMTRVHPAKVNARPIHHAGAYSSPRSSSFYTPSFLLFRASSRHANSLSRSQCACYPETTPNGLGSAVSHKLKSGPASPTALEYIPLLSALGVDIMRMCSRLIEVCIVRSPEIRSYFHARKKKKPLPVFYLSLNCQYALLMSPVGETRTPEPPPYTFKVINPLSCDNAIHDCSEK